MIRVIHCLVGFISTWNREGSLGKESRRKWMAGKWGECLIGGTGAWVLDLPGETKTDFLQPDVCWTKELERVGGGAVILQASGAPSLPPLKSESLVERSLPASREAHHFLDCHRPCRFHGTEALPPPPNQFRKL